MVLNITGYLIIFQIQCRFSFDLVQIQSRFCLNLFSPDFVQTQSRFCQDLVQILSRFCLIQSRFSLDLVQILPRFSLDLVQIQSRFSLDLVLMILSCLEQSTGTVYRSIAAFQGEGSQGSNIHLEHSTTRFRAQDYMDLNNLHGTFN